MLIPKNAIAQTIQRLEQENEMHLDFIRTRNEALDLNMAAIADMASLAEWEEIPDFSTDLQPAIIEQKAAAAAAAAAEAAANG